MCVCGVGGGCGHRPPPRDHSRKSYIKSTTTTVWFPWAILNTSLDSLSLSILFLFLINLSNVKARQNLHYHYTDKVSEHFKVHDIYTIYKDIHPDPYLPSPS